MYNVFSSAEEKDRSLNANKQTKMVQNTKVQNKTDKTKQQNKKKVLQVIFIKCRDLSKMKNAKKINLR